MGIIKTTKLGACPNCGCIELNVEEMPNYASSPRFGQPVYCPQCDLSGEVGGEVDTESDVIIGVDWFNCP